MAENYYDNELDNPEHPEAIKEAQKYIAKIKNTEKKRYAQDYFNWMLTANNPPDSSSYTVSYMAKQSVRMELERIMKPYGW